MSPDQAVKLVRSVLTAELRDPKWVAACVSGDYGPNCREHLSHPSTGHCAVAAEAVYYLLGGKRAGLVPVVGRDDGGSTHWWIVDRAKKLIIDPTGDQYTDFGLDPPYDRGVAKGFLSRGKGPTNRAAAVLARTSQHGLPPARYMSRAFDDRDLMRRVVKELRRQGYEVDDETGAGHRFVTTAQSLVQAAVTAWASDNR